MQTPIGHRQMGTSTIVGTVGPRRREERNRECRLPGAHQNSPDQNQGDGCKKKVESRKMAIGQAANSLAEVVLGKWSQVWERRRGA